MSIVQSGGKDGGVNLYAHAVSPTQVSKAFEAVATFAPASGLKEALDDLLADSVDIYFRAHGFHWNVKGQDFSQYHELFQEIYEDLYGSIDPIAENIRKMNFDAPFDIRDFARLSSIPGVSAASDPRSMAVDLAKALDQLIVCLNKAFQAASIANEQGIANFVADRIDRTKKWIWQLSASTATAQM